MLIDTNYYADTLCCARQKRVLKISHLSSFLPPFLPPSLLSFFGILSYVVGRVTGEAKEERG